MISTDLPLVFDTILHGYIREHSHALLSVFADDRIHP